MRVAGWGVGEENNELPQGIKKVGKGETPIWLIEFEHSLLARPECQEVGGQGSARGLASPPHAPGT